MKEKIKEFLKQIGVTKDTVERTVKTFIEAFFAYIVTVIAAGDFFDGENSKKALVGLLMSALAAGVSAVMNMFKNSTPAQLGGGMSFESWVNKYLGKKTDYDGAYGVQCVDLIDCYIAQCLGLKKGFWGNAKNWWTDRNSSTWLKSNFEFITPTFKNGELKKGDIGIRTSGTYGHIFVIAGSASNGKFKYYDQNATGNGDKMTLREKAFTSSYINGILRPKNQDNLKSTEKYVSPVKWQNGSTKETVYEQSNLTENVGTINKKESAYCYGKKGSGYIVVYGLDGSSKHKVGFAKYAGGVKSAPSGGRSYENGSTKETVYADTAKKTKIGNLDKYENCTCLAKIDGMYLVLYKITGTSNYKVGFVSYAG